MNDYNALSAEIQHVTRALRTGQVGLANHALVLLTERLSVLTAGSDQANRADLTKLLHEIIDAQARHDDIRLADLLDFELTQLLGTSAKQVTPPAGPEPRAAGSESGPVPPEQTTGDRDEETRNRDR